MKINYIDLFSRVIPEWMARSNQKSQEVGFGSDAIGNGPCRQLEKFASNTMMMSW